jgi:hypothetical protein
VSPSFESICRASTYVGAALIGAAALAGASSSQAFAAKADGAPQPASVAAAPTLTCHAPSFQACYFRVINAPTGQDRVFSVKGQTSLTAPDLAPGRDRYMLMVNRLPPSSEDFCGGQFDKRYSLWCKKAVVRDGSNG